MNTTTPLLQPAGGWVYYDAACGLCSGGVSSWFGRVMQRQGFVWLPLQTPGLAAQLGITDADLRSEMKLRLPDGRVLGGADAWAAMFRRVWWLWPLAILMGLPGLRGLSHACYRIVAHNRYSISHCVLSPAPRRSTSRRPRVFFQLP